MIFFSSQFNLKNEMSKRKTPSEPKSCQTKQKICQQLTIFCPVSGRHATSLNDQYQFVKDCLEACKRVDFTAFTQLKSSPFWSQENFEGIYTTDGQSCLGYLLDQTAKPEQILECTKILESCSWSKFYIHRFDYIIAPNPSVRFIENIPFDYSHNYKARNSLLNWILRFDLTLPTLQPIVNFFDKYDFQFINNMVELESWWIYKCFNISPLKKGQDITDPLIKNVLVDITCLADLDSNCSCTLCGFKKINPFVIYFAGKSIDDPTKSNLPVIEKITSSYDLNNRATRSRPKNVKIPYKNKIMDYTYKPQFLSYFDFYTCFKRVGFALPSLRTIFMIFDAVDACLKLGSTWNQQDALGNTLLHVFASDANTTSPKMFYQAVETIKYNNGLSQVRYFNKTAMACIILAVQSCFFDVTIENNAGFTAIDYFLPSFYLSFNHLCPEKITLENLKNAKSTIAIAATYNLHTFKCLLHGKVKAIPGMYYRVTELFWYHVLDHIFCQPTHLIGINILHSLVFLTGTQSEQPYTFDQTFAIWNANVDDFNSAIKNIRNMAAILSKKTQDPTKMYNMMDIVLSSFYTHYLYQKSVESHSLPETIPYPTAPITTIQTHTFPNKQIYLTFKYSKYINKVTDTFVAPLKQNINSMMLGMTYEQGQDYFNFIEQSRQTNDLTERTKIASLCPTPTTFRQKVWQCSDLRNLVYSYIYT